MNSEVNKQSLVDQWVNLSVIEMYYEDGMTEREIAEVIGYSITAVYEFLAAYEEV
jgi:transposase